MKAIIIYDTTTGNTKAMAYEMKEILEKYNHTCEIHRDQDIKGEIKNDSHYFDSFDLLLLGSCTHGFQPALTFNSFIKSIKNYYLNDKSLICFSSSGFPGVWKDTCNKIRENFPNTKDLGNFGCVLRNYEATIKQFEGLIKSI